VNYNYI